jgi:hypothetical protein
MTTITTVDAEQFENCRTQFRENGFLVLPQYVPSMRDDSYRAQP